MAPLSERSNHDPLLIRAPVAILILLVGMTILILALIAVSPIFSGIGGGVAGVGIAGLCCCRSYNEDGRRR